MNETSGNIKAPESVEIDLNEVFRKIRDGRKTIFKWMGIFFVISLIIVLTSPKEYKSEVTLLVETGAGSAGMSGLLQQFGGLAGINIGSGAGADALRPDLYPVVIKSTPFLLEVLEQKVKESKYDSTLTVSQFLERHTRSSLISNLIGYTFGLPGSIIGIFKGKPKEIEDQINSQRSKPLKLTLKQASGTGALRGRITAKEGESINILSISVEMQDPVVAAQLTDSVVKNLTKYIIDYRTQKAKNDLQFVTNRHAEAETKYKHAQQTLALYTDQNRNVILASARTIEQRLQAEYTLAFNIYNTLSQQLEQAKLKVQQETPVFKVLNPAQVPFGKSKPKSLLIMFGMVFCGGLIGVTISFFKSFKISIL